MIGAPATLRFRLTDELVASAPPEARGLRRDQVRLLVAGTDGTRHERFASIAEYLEPGDVVVVNASPTMPAALQARRGGSPVIVHLSTLQDDGTWIIELRRPENSGPVLDALANEVVNLPPNGSVRLIEAADDGGPGAVRLWRARVATPGGLRRFMARHGRPIRYGYVDQDWPLFMYQTSFSDTRAWPGSAEMPSAGRPITRHVLGELRRKGVRVASLRLDTGVSSQEAGELPYPERYEVPAATAAIVNRGQARSKRVVAVGTTVTRALESAAGPRGVVHAAGGWTDLVLGPDRPARVVTGLITGFHQPGTSHVQLLQAVAGEDLVAAAYESALTEGYLWHEFGDSCLFLPARTARP